MLPEIILQTKVGGEWSELASFPLSGSMFFCRILFSGCFGHGKHLRSTSRATKINLQFKVIITVVFFIANSVIFFKSPN